MGGVNKQTLVGNLGGDPELQTFPNGSSIVKFKVVTTENWTDRNTGEPREHTQWHRIVCRGVHAEKALNGLNKGAKVYIEGKYKSRIWLDDQIEREIFEVHVDFLEMLYNPALSNQNQPNFNQTQPPSNYNNNYADNSNQQQGFQRSSHAPQYNKGFSGNNSNHRRNDKPNQYNNGQYRGPNDGGSSNIPHYEWGNHLNRKKFQR